VLVADEAAATYSLFMETGQMAQVNTAEFAAAVDQSLGVLNMEYQGKRRSGRLGPLTVHWLRPGTADEYRSVCVRAGQREMQFKPSVLQYRKDLSLSFHDFTVG
jgi:hypothetical protein